MKKIFGNNIHKLGQKKTCSIMPCVLVENQGKISTLVKIVGGILTGFARFCFGGTANELWGDL